MTEELVLGSYVCTAHEWSSSAQVIVIFRESAADHGGTALMRMPNEMATKFTDGTTYELFARESDEPAPPRLLRKRK